MASACVLDLQHVLGQRHQGHEAGLLPSDGAAGDEQQRVTRPALVLHPGRPIDEQANCRRVHEREPGYVRTHLAEPIDQRRAVQRLEETCKIAGRILLRDGTRQLELIGSRQLNRDGLRFWYPNRSKLTHSLPVAVMRMRPPASSVMDNSTPPS